jgi:hypothetical protein
VSQVRDLGGKGAKLLKSGRHAKRSTVNRSLHARSVTLRRCGLGDAASRASQVSEQPVAKVVNPSMHSDLLLPSPRILHNRRLTDVLNLFDDVQLTEPIDRRVFIISVSNQFIEAVVDIAHVTKPVVNQAER